MVSKQKTKTERRNVSRSVPHSSIHAHKHAAPEEAQAGGSHTAASRREATAGSGGEGVLCRSLYFGLGGRTIRDSVGAVLRGGAGVGDS